jgi:16S rRNA (cytosine967-C5)-methyltransferase
MAVLASSLVDKAQLLRLTAQELQWAQSKSAVLNSLSTQHRFCIPDWIWDDWVAQLGEDEAGRLAAYLDQEAPLDLRLNLAQGQGVAHLRDELSLAGIAAQPIDWLPEGLRCQGRPAVQGLGAFKQGHFEVQDAGSQLLARLCAPQRGQTVVDFCAGAGGKTLALGALMRNSGRIYALDTSSSRLARLKPRLARSGLSNVWAIAISGLNDLRIKRLRAKADLVLVDAPCTGLGTLRRNPDLKWRQTSQGLGDLLSLQASILRAASTLVKPGGRLVYATCSLKREENEGQVETFLKAYPEFSMDSAERILLRQGISPQSQALWFGEQGELRLWPHRSDTDGFFGVNLVRA